MSDCAVRRCCPDVVPGAPSRSRSTPELWEIPCTAEICSICVFELSSGRNIVALSSAMLSMSPVISTRPLSQEPLP